MANSEASTSPTGDGETRRDFLTIATGVFATVGGVAALWPLIHQMTPAADTLALATTEVDVSSLEPGQSITVVWQGKPVFIRRRTQEEIKSARGVDPSSLPDPQTAAQRTQKPEWLIVVGVCTHLGCIPAGQAVGDAKGEYGGWFCPCHGSHYDTSGRIRKGPAPTNLPVPAYKFTSDDVVLIG